MKFLCEQCKAKYQIADEKVAGKTVRMKCRKCGHLIEVRAAVTETSVSSVPPPPSGVGAAKPPSAPQKPTPPRAPVRRTATPLATSLASAKPARASDKPKPASALAGAFKSSVQQEDEISAPFDMAELSPADEWYVAINGVPVGPIRIAEVRRKAALGAVTGDSLAWQEGLDEWRAVRLFPELAAIVREAAASGRTSLTPQPPEGRRSSAPPPPPRASARMTRSNVVPITSRHSTGAATTAEKLDDVAPDPFALPPPPAAVAAGPAVASPPIAAVAATASMTPPAPVRKAPPWMIIGMLIAFAAFGVTAAVAVFLRPAQPAPTVVVQAPAAPVAPAAAPIAAATAPAPARTDESAAGAPSAARASPIAMAGAARSAAPGVAAPTTPTSTGKSLDLHGLTQGAANVTPTDEPGGQAPRAPGQCFSEGQVQQVIGLHQVAIRRSCWERNPTNKPTVNVSVSLTIGPDGSPQGVTASGDDPSVATCIASDVRGWRFPAMGCSQKTAFSFKFVRQ